MRGPRHCEKPARQSDNECHYSVLLRTDSISVGEFHCNGRSRRSEQEAARSHEIVIPQSGAYIRRDASGDVYLDETAIGFFEAHRPYSIEHLERRPDLTTVISIRDVAGFPAFAGTPDKEATFFGRSAIRATPEIHLLHRRLLAMVKDDYQDSFAVEESALLLATRAVERSHATPDLSNRPGSGTANDVTIAVAEYVRTRFKERLTLADIARYTGYSVFHLCRMFNARMKTSIHRYIKSLRLESAHSALVDTDLPVTTIALEHGYSSHAHFTSQFSNWFGQSPTAVRRGYPG